MKTVAFSGYAIGEIQLRGQQPLDARFFAAKRASDAAMMSPMKHSDEAPVQPQRLRGALLGCCVGDAFGRPFEGVARSDVRLSAQLDARAAGAGPWDYSDDTEMMISVAESFLSCGRVDPSDLLYKMVGNYEPARGYSTGMKRIFAALHSGTRYDEVVRSSWVEGSSSNGAAVRVAPLACVIHDEDALVAAAETSARISHAHPMAVGGCVLMALAVFRALRHPDSGSCNPLEFIANLKQSPHVGAAYALKLEQVLELLGRTAWPPEAAAALGSGVTAEESVPVALFAFARFLPSFEGVALGAAGAGGDTDTITAMSCTLAGALLGESAISARWQANLVNGRKGRDYVLSLAERLCEWNAAKRIG